jgi:hypothetical protein
MRLHSFVLLVGVTATFSACSNEEELSAEITTCEKLAIAVLEQPENFQITKQEIEETSEGDFVNLQVSYVDSSGAVVDRQERCWFAGYGEHKRITKFYLGQPDGDFDIIDGENLATYVNKSKS